MSSAYHTLKINKKIINFVFMQRYFLHLAYSGTAYCGWQRQPNALAIQQVIEESLEKLLRQPTSIMGCGRTDTGVHASYYVAHMESDAQRIGDADFLYHLNCVLPHDIAIMKIEKTDLHARFDAKYREYKYYIQRRKDPFKTHHAWLITPPLDLQAMQSASKILLEYTDFTSFARLHSDNKTNICRISHIDWQITPDSIVFTVGADRFLRGMIRAIVGTLVDVGRGKLSVEDFRAIILAMDRAKASAAAPAEGLFLTDVKY